MTRLNLSELVEDPSICLSRLKKKSPALLEPADPLTYFHYALEILVGLLLDFDGKISVNLLVVEYMELACTVKSRICCHIVDCCAV